MRKKSRKLEPEEIRRHLRELDALSDQSDEELEKTERKSDQAERKSDQTERKSDQTERKSDQTGYSAPTGYRGRALQSYHMRINQDAGDIGHM